MSRTLLIFVLLLSSVATAVAAGGVKGRAAWRGEVGAGVTVRAYRSIADIGQEKVVATSAPTGLDGTYCLDLPPGSYYLTARNYAGKPEAGKLFCYYSGAPVTVRANAYTNVGFNLIRIPAEAPPAATATSGIKGSITFQGAPLERAYLYVYKDAADGFKGPGYFIQPVEKGTFRLRLPPGEYWLLARKRAKGGSFGPIETGDYFNFYYGNPVRISAGQTREIQLETITRLSMLEEDALPLRGIKGVVLAPGKRPAGKIHVFAYRDAAMSGVPDFFSAPTGPDGRFELPLVGDGPFYLLARENFGGPAVAGELYGKFSGKDGAALKLDAQNQVREVIIHVEKKDP
jgi:hypothetical protein